MSSTGILLYHACVGILGLFLSGGGSFEKGPGLLKVKVKGN
jgi:hypothetical protein